MAEPVCGAIHLHGAGAAHIDGNQFAPVEETRRAGLLHRLQRQLTGNRRRAADDHAVVMAVGQLDPPFDKKIRHEKIGSQLARSKPRGGNRIDGVTGRAVSGAQFPLLRHHVTCILPAWYRRSLRTRSMKAASAHVNLNHNIHGAFWTRTIGRKGAEYKLYYVIPLCHSGEAHRKARGVFELGGGFLSPPSAIASD